MIVGQLVVLAVFVFFYVFWPVRKLRAINRLIAQLPGPEAEAVRLALLSNLLRDWPEDEGWVVRCARADYHGQPRPVSWRCKRGWHEWGFVPMPDQSFFGGPIRVERCQGCKAKRGLMDGERDVYWMQIP